MTRSRVRKSKRARVAQGTRVVLKRLPLATAISAVLAGAPPAFAQDQADTSILGEVMVTAQKRQENLQDVPLSIQSFGTEQLEELNITDFADYVKYLPSVSFTTIGPGFSVAYFRGVASGENNNHSGPQPTVGMYLDEQPITTIQGALDIHLYDIARVEALAGPQGTLYGASSMAGTIRIITNKPDPGKFEAAYGLEANTVKNGSEGYTAEGFVNVPVGESAAVRLVGWYSQEPGYIDNVPGTRTFPTSGGCISNTSPPAPGCVTSPALAEDRYNDVETYGARAALRVDLNDSWTLTPQVMAQKQHTNGGFSFDPRVGDLELTRYYPEESEDKWLQAALTVEGKLSNFDLVYAGAYLKRDDFVNSDYSDYAYFYDQCCQYGYSWVDDNDVPLADPSQYITGKDYYKRQSHELRLSSPQDWRLRFVAGLFYQKQKHEIYQRYWINGLGAALEVPGSPDTIWLTDQKREDQDYAVFGEMTYDITDKLAVTGGLRWFDAKNSLQGFFGFNDAYSSNYGVFLCATPFVPFNTAPCTNLDDEVSESGVVPKINLTYQIDDARMAYVTYSEGFRPGGINRNGTVPPYKSDYLKNYEVGWKSTWGGRVRFNGAVFLEKWDDIQFSFLPPSGAGLTVIRNAGKAEIKGIEADLAWAVTSGLNIHGGFSLIDAELAEDYIPDPTLPPAAPEGTQLPVTPKFKSNLTARYTFGVGQAEMYVQGAAVYQSRSWSDLLDEDRGFLGDQPSYAVADFTAGYEGDSFAVEMYVNNAFDERAQVFTFAQCATSVCGVNPYFVTNQPRTIGLKFRQDF